MRGKNVWPEHMRIIVLIRALNITIVFFGLPFLSLPYLSQPFLHYLFFHCYLQTCESPQCCAPEDISYTSRN